MNEYKSKQVMRKLVTILAFMVVGIGYSFSGGNPGLSEEIEQKVTVDLTNIELNERRKDYVVVRFQIKNGLIVVEGINGTQEALKKLIMEELEDIRIDSEHLENQSYISRFTFERQ